MCPYYKNNWIVQKVPVILLWIPYLSSITSFCWKLELALEWTIEAKFSKKSLAESSLQERELLNSTILSNAATAWNWTKVIGMLNELLYSK